MADVFISYAREDRDFVRKLHDALAKLNRDTWVDWEGIPLTAEWWREICAGIEAADNFVFVISPESVASANCRKEIDYASRNNKRLIPLYRRDVPDKDVPEAMAKMNRIFFYDSDDFEATFASLIKALDEDLDWKRAHSRLLVRAKEWEGKDQEKSLLLRGKDLQEAEEWQGEAGIKEPKPTLLQSQYILASRQAETHRQRLTLGAVVCALLLTIGLAIAALIQRSIARQEARIAQARQLAAEAELARDTSPELSALLGVESTRLFPLPENNVVLQQALPLLRRAVAQVQHQGPVNAVAFSLDGRYVATGSDDGTARVFETLGGKPVTQIVHKGPVNAVAFSPDGRYVATGSDDKTAGVFEALSGRPIGTIEFRGAVRAVAFSPDGRYVAAGSDDNTARVLDVLKRKLIAVLRHRGAVRAVAFSPTGRYLATGSFDNRARVFEVPVGKKVTFFKFQRDEGGINTIAFSPDGRYVATAGGKTIQVFETLGGKSVARMEAPDQAHAVAFSPDGRYVATGSWDNTARVFEALTGRLVARLEDSGSVNAVAFSPDGRYVATGSTDHTARVFEVFGAGSATHLDHHGSEGGMYHMAFSPDGRYLAAAGDKTLQVFETLTGNPLPSLEGLERGSSVNAVALSRDGCYLAMGDLNGTAWVVETSSGKPAARLAYEGLVVAIAFSPDGRYVFTAGKDNKARVFEALTGRLVARLKASDSVYAAAFSPDGRYVATAGKGGAVGVFEALSGKPVAHFGGHRGGNEAGVVYAVAFSPDGRYIVTADGDGTVEMSDALSGKPVARLEHQGVFDAMAFSPDGRYVVAKSTDNTAKVFEPLSGKQVARIAYPEGVLAVAFSPDGRYVATGSGDNTARIFEALTGKSVTRMDCAGPVKAVEFSADGRHVLAASFEPDESGLEILPVVERFSWGSEDLVNEACSRLNRNLTQAESAQYFQAQAYHWTCRSLPKGR